MASITNVHFQLTLDAHGFVLELRDQMCDSLRIPKHDICLMASDGHRALNMFDTLNEIRAKRDASDDHQCLELMLFPTDKSSFSNDFWAFRVEHSQSKHEFIANTKTKMSYLEALRGGQTPCSIAEIKRKLIAKKVQISAYELHQFVLWSDVRVLTLLHDGSISKCTNQLRWEMDYALQREIAYGAYYPLDTTHHRETNHIVTSMLTALSLPECIRYIIIEMIEDGFRTDPRDGQQTVTVSGNWSKCTLRFDSV